MKITFINKILWVIAALALPGLGQLPDQFAVSAFNVTDAEFFELNNFVIKHPKAFSGTDTLLDIPSPPPFIRPGQVVMRKKYGADYRLYIGDLDTSAFNVFPPLYVFKLPEWSKSGQAMWYRFYTEVTDNRNLDIETVFFDNEFMYVQHHDTIRYSRNDTWDWIAGRAEPPYGALFIDSEPRGAEVYLYGKATGRKTPALFEDIVAGRYEVELFLPEYRFQRRSVAVGRGYTSQNTFQLIADFDTLLILGEPQHGLLVLPYPPIDSAYRLGDSVISIYSENLLAGKHRLTWNGGGFYRDVDTVIEIPAGKAVYFNVPFVRLTGTAVFEVYPLDALLCVEGFPCYPGDARIELPSGFHTARASRFGYEPERQKFVVAHGKTSLIKMYLAENRDRDRDGFDDLIDKCPRDYGLYDGCPKPDFKTTMSLKWGELGEYMETEPFSFSFSAIGYITRVPTSRRFHTFLSSFSGGRLGGLNNYQGVNFGNIYQVSFRGFMAQVELGQWTSGVKFRRPDTLHIPTKNNNYAVWYDSLYNIDPGVFFPSTAASVGFKYRLLNYSVGYSLGHQWEDIVIKEIENRETGEFTEVYFNNDWWFHELMVEADLFMDTFATPSFYTKFKFPFGTPKRTMWHSLQFGLQVRFRPVNWKKPV